MSDINKALGNFGSPRPFHVNGQRWLLSWADQPLLGDFCSYLKENARQAAKMAYRDMSEEAADRMVLRVNNEIQKKMYEPFGQYFNAELANTRSPGWIRMLWLLMERNYRSESSDEKFTEDDVVAIMQEIEPGSPDEKELVTAVTEVLSAAIKDHAAKKKGMRSKWTENLGTENKSTPS